MGLMEVYCTLSNILSPICSGWWDWWKYDRRPLCSFSHKSKSQSLVFILLSRTPLFSFRLIWRLSNHVYLDTQVFHCSNWTPQFSIVQIAHPSFNFLKLDTLVFILLFSLSFLRSSPLSLPQKWKVINPKVFNQAPGINLSDRYSSVNNLSFFLAGLGICSSVFWANRSFFAKKWAHERFA